MGGKAFETGGITLLHVWLQCGYSKNVNAHHITRVLHVCIFHLSSSDLKQQTLIGLKLKSVGKSAANSDLTSFRT